MPFDCKINSHTAARANFGAASPGKILNTLLKASWAGRKSSRSKLVIPEYH